MNKKHLNYILKLCKIEAGCLYPEALWLSFAVWGDDNGTFLCQEAHCFLSKFVVPAVASHKPRLSGEGWVELIEPRVFISQDSWPAICGSCFRVKVLSVVPDWAPLIYTASAHSVAEKKWNPDELSILKGPKLRGPLFSRVRGHSNFQNSTLVIVEVKQVYLVCMLRSIQMWLSGSSYAVGKMGMKVVAGKVGTKLLHIPRPLSLPRKLFHVSYQHAFHSFLISCVSCAYTWNIPVEGGIRLEVPSMFENVHMWGNSFSRESCWFVWKFIENIFISIYLTAWTEQAVLQVMWGMTLLSLTAQIRNEDLALFWLRRPHSDSNSRRSNGWCCLRLSLPLMRGQENNWICLRLRRLTAN